MKQTLKPGAELELLTQAELRAVVEETLSGYLRPPDRIRARDGVPNGSALPLTITAYTVDVGMRFILTRCLVEAPGAGTPAAPFTNATGYLLLQRGLPGGTGLPVDFKSLVAGAGGIPALWLYSDSFGPSFLDGEAVQVVIAGGAGPATPVTVSIEGYLEPMGAEDVATGL